MYMRALLIVAAAMFSIGISIANAHMEHFTAAQNQQLANVYNKGKVNCCTDAEAASVQDPDWGIEGERYWVVVQGAKRQVPPEAVVEGPNRWKVALLWLIQQPLGVQQIKCFMPGALG